jgi:hypothetical protein
LSLIGLTIPEKNGENFAGFGRNLVLRKIGNKGKISFLIFAHFE